MKTRTYKRQFEPPRSHEDVKGLDGEGLEIIACGWLAYAWTRAGTPRIAAKLKAAGYSPKLIKSVLTATSVRIAFDAIQRARSAEEWEKLRRL